MNALPLRLRGLFHMRQRYNKGGCVIKVRIYSDGNYAIEDLEINGKPIREYIRSDNK